MYVYVIYYIISIHSLHTEGDIIPTVAVAQSLTFQSTPSTRRETLPVSFWIIPLIFQSTPSTRRETFQ